MKHRIVFMGSPDFAIPTLAGLAKSYTIAGVVTQPDRPAGRGRLLTPPPVKTLAQELELPCIQPRRLSEPQATKQLIAWAPDMIVVAAFGQILRPSVLDLPPFGCINLHASLLPRWRGAAPIQAAILHGDPSTGVTIMRMDPGVDTGAILGNKKIPIQPDDTAASLSKRLAVLGAGLLLETLPGYLNGSIIPQTQDESQATYAPILKKGDGQLDFSLPAADLARRVRAFNPWPGAYTSWRGKRIKVHRALSVPSDDSHLPAPGQFTIYRGLPAIGTTQGILVIEELQPAGKKSMPGKVFLQGARNWDK